MRAVHKPKRGLRITKVCKHCGKKFIVAKWATKQAPCLFCSTDCKKAHIENPKERLLRRCDISGGPKSCWEWKGAIFAGTGYGQIQYKGKPIATHRLSWIVFNGPIPNGLLVCHSCDNKICVNPDHLFIGTQVDNMKDMKSKGRDNYPKGNQLPVAKLNPQLVREIRKLADKGFGTTRLAKMFGVTNSPIYCIIKGKTWRHVK